MKPPAPPAAPPTPAEPKPPAETVRTRPCDWEKKPMASKASAPGVPAPTKEKPAAGCDGEGSR